jgi:hypothetical protein
LVAKHFQDQGSMLWLWSQFSAIFCEKNGVFLQTNVMYDTLFAEFSFIRLSKTPFFADFVCENILKRITSVPALVSLAPHLVLRTGLWARFLNKIAVS